MADNLEIVIVVQDEPRDGIQVYAVKDEAEFKQCVRDSINEDAEDDGIHLGVLYFDEDGMSSVTGHAVTLPFEVSRVCRDCWEHLNLGYSADVGDTIFTQIVADEECSYEGHVEDDQQENIDIELPGSEFEDEEG